MARTAHGNARDLGRRLALTAGLAVLAFALAAITRLAAAPWAFSDTDDATTQATELADYLAATGRPARLVQSDSAAHPKVSQLVDIDASPRGFGRNACGPVAAAAALGGAGWRSLVGEIVRAAGPAYLPEAGIQPSPYAEALRAVFGAERVTVFDRASLGEIYRQLDAGRVVIVDIKVGTARRVPTARPPNVAHFARVLAIDAEAGEIILENTLAGPPTWTVPFADFVAAWQLPETTASSVPRPAGAEPVTRWLVAVERPPAP